MSHTILLTGATGYIGGRLLRRLEESGYRVRCLARRPEFLRERVSPSTEVLKGDVLDRTSLWEAMKGVETAYYLIHSMGSSLDDIKELDENAALEFGRVAKEQGVRRIIYLGLVGDSSADFTSQVTNRQLVGSLLAEAGVPVVEFRASIIIGSGSMSFEVIRALVERLPIVIIPNWMTVRTHPIAIGNVLDYLCFALDMNATGHRIIDIGGSDNATYEEMMHEYARQRRIHRIMIRFPFNVAFLSSLCIALATPVYARIGRKLIDSALHPGVGETQRPPHTFGIRIKGISEAISEALRNEDREFAETHWWHSLSSSDTPKYRGTMRFGNRLIYERRMTINAPAIDAFTVIQKVGGQNGWYYADWLWNIRGFIDLLVGGVGLRRGRRHPVHIQVGDVIDWWRVEAFESGKSLLLYAEMKLPGRAWLELSVENHKPHPEIVQTAIFDPVGVFGLAYWYGIYPLHAVVFRGMLRNMARAAESAKTI